MRLRVLLLRLLATSLLLYSATEAEETCAWDGTGSPPASCRSGGDGDTTAPKQTPSIAKDAKASPRPSGVGSSDKMVQTEDLIMQEINEVKSFMGLCEERIQLLQDLKDLVSSGEDISLPASHVRVLQEKLPLLSAVTGEPEKVTTGSAEDYLISKSKIHVEDEVAFVQFLPLRNPRATSSQATQTSTLPSTMLVAVLTNGTICLYTPAGELAASFDAGHSAPIKHVALTPSHDEYWIATSDPTGVIRVHKVAVRQKRLSKEDLVSRRASEDRASIYLGSQVNCTVQFLHKMLVPLGTDGELAKVTSLAISVQQGTKYIVTGDAEGKVSIFNRHGNFSAQIDATVMPGGIEGLHTQGSNLIFRAGVEWGYINLAQLEVTPIDCAKFDGSITTATIDSQQAARVLVADEAGTVWVFNVKDKKHCKVEHRFPRGATRAPLELSSVRGFALALERHHGGQWPVSLVALNMSVVGKKKEQGQAALPPVVWRTPRGKVRDWAVFKRYQHGDLLAFLSDDGHEIEIMELLMQAYTPPAQDAFSNFKLPVIAVVVVLVLGYQFVKQRGRGGRGFDPSDIAGVKGKKYKSAGLKGKKF
mmetsp:Transcript_51360/g.94927  ORF Transcript_51360/g.94927 Transcript_51360/m.94927 type:complete len:590 (-) Transcript_51360:52-1821(-)